MSIVSSELIDKWTEYKRYLDEDYSDRCLMIELEVERQNTSKNLDKDDPKYFSSKEASNLMHKDKPTFEGFMDYLEMTQ